MLIAIECSRASSLPIVLHDFPSDTKPVFRRAFSADCARAMVDAGAAVVA